MIFGALPMLMYAWPRLYAINHTDAMVYNNSKWLRRKTALALVHIDLSLSRYLNIQLVMAETAGCPLWGTYRWPWHVCIRSFWNLIYHLVFLSFSSKHLASVNCIMIENRHPWASTLGGQHVLCDHLVRIHLPKNLIGDINVNQLFKWYKIHVAKS